jgi:hypothetical protein
MKKLILNLLLISAFSFHPSAFGQQTVWFIMPTNAAIIQTTISAPARQVYPEFYPAEAYPAALQPGTNAVLLNPGLWTINFGAGALYTFNIPTNTPATNNFLFLMTNGAPPVIVGPGLTTNIGLVWTNGVTLKTNSFCFTNGLLMNIQ